MAIGKVSVFPFVIPSGVSTSSEVDLGRGYSKIYFDCTGAKEQTQFYAARASGGTSRLVRNVILSGVVAPSTFMVGSACSGSIVEAPQLQGLQFLKVAATGVVADGATLYLYCSDV